MELIHWKYLKLISPELAEKKGLPAEVPVFISPADYSFDRVCRECGVTYNPLVYHHGLIQPHHFHQFNGGIYHFSVFASSTELAIRITGNPWAVVIRPLGKSIYVEGETRSERVEITRFLAHCAIGNCKEYLNSGLVISPLGYLEPRLEPICGVDKHPFYKDRILFNFEITQGEVSFSRDLVPRLDTT